MRGTIGALRVFFAYLEQAELLVGADGSPRRNPMRTIDAPPCPQRPNDFLRPHEDRALLNAECPHHHRIVVWLLRYTGVRVAEAQALTIADLDLTPEGEALTVRGSKTPAATRTIPLLPQLLPLMHEHLEFLRGRLPVTPRYPAAGDEPRHADDDELPVASRQACRLRGRGSAHRLYLWDDPPGPPRPRLPANELRRESLSVSPHTLRRTFGSDLINRGLRLEAVSKLLGHSSTTITERAYAQLLAPTIRRELFEVLWEDPGMRAHHEWRRVCEPLGRRVGRAVAQPSRLRADGTSREGEGRRLTPVSRATKVVWLGWQASMRLRQSCRGAAGWPLSLPGGRQRPSTRTCGGSSSSQPRARRW